MTNAEAHALEIDISALQTQLRNKKEQLRRIRQACDHDWSEPKRAGFFYVGISTVSWKRVCDICGDSHVWRADADESPLRQRV